MVEFEIPTEGKKQNNGFKDGRTPERSCSFAFSIICSAVYNLLPVLVFIM